MISIKKISKKYNNKYVFRNISFDKMIMRNY